MRWWWNNFVSVMDKIFLASVLTCPKLETCKAAVISHHIRQPCKIFIRINFVDSNLKKQSRWINWVKRGITSFRTVLNIERFECQHLCREVEQYSLFINIRFLAWNVWRLKQALTFSPVKVSASSYITRTNRNIISIK